MSQLRSISGQISWVASKTRHGTTFECCCGIVWKESRYQLPKVSKQNTEKTEE